MTKTYSNPNAFKQALKARVKTRAGESGRSFNRMLQLVLFERFLIRIYAILGDAVILKGGFALELRLSQARTTKDIDVRVEGNLDELVERIREEAAQQGDDYLTFNLNEEANFEEMLGEQVVYGGRRIKIRAMLAGQPFGQPFHLDLSVADRLLLPADMMKGADVFQFIGLEPVEHRIYPAEAHVSEKLHALTLNRPNSQNSRAKDLVDIGLLAANTHFIADALRASIKATFEFRNTHQLPATLPAPPTFWNNLYGNMSSETQLPWNTLDDLHAFCARFLNPILAGRLEENDRWSHPPNGAAFADWRWSTDDSQTV